MRIVDMHAHMDEVADLNWFDTPEKLIKLMDDANIELAVVSAYLNVPGPDPDAFERMCRCVEPYKDRLCPFIRMDPWFGKRTVEVLVEAHRNHPNLSGVKLHPGHYTLHPYGEATVALIQKAGELGLPVLFHCGDEEMCLPLQIGEMMKQCPDTKVILAHMGGLAHYRDAISVAKKYPNIFIDTSEIPYVGMIRRVVDEIGADRVLFGTDAPFCDPLVELKKVEYAGLTEQEFEKVCSLNGLKLLKRG